jgi:uncharacterized membrane protein YdbT with pleckstrin-like domain
MNLLSIFSITSFSFDGKKDYENVLALLYRHWFTLYADILGFIILFLVPFIIRWFITDALTGWGAMPLFNLLIAVYVLVWWLSVFYRITMYLLDTWIVTDHRIIDNEQRGFFNRTVSELHLNRIQDISVKVDGLIATFFDYGNIEIQTAGTEPKFIFKQIPHPNAVRELIMKAHIKFISTHSGDIEIHERIPKN